MPKKNLSGTVLPFKTIYIYSVELNNILLMYKRDPLVFDKALYRHKHCFLNLQKV